MSSPPGPLEAQLIVDAQVAHLEAEVTEKISRLHGEVNDNVSRLRAEVDEKITLLRKGLDAQFSILHKELDTQSSALRTAFKEERSRLNGPRNALSPIHRLPHEVLSRILYESLTTSEVPAHVLQTLNPYSRIRKISDYNNGHDRYDFEIWPRGRDTIRLCHICQHWRKVALSYPQLWSHIQVKRSTRPEMLELVIANAKQAALDLDLHGSSIAHFEAGDVLSNLLKASAGRLRSLALCCPVASSPSSEPDILQRLMAPVAELKSMQLVITGRIVTEDLKLFPLGAPNLNCLEIRGIVLPWSSPLLLSRHLTVLALHHTPHLNSTTMWQFLSFLRHATQLKALHIDLPNQDRLTWDDVGGQPALPIELPNIETLEIISQFFAPLLIVMKAIFVEHGDDVAIKVSCAHCGESRYNLQAISDFAISSAAPEQVEIGHQRSGPRNGFVVSCELRRTAVYPLDFLEDDDSLFTYWPEERPWATFDVGNAFPFPAIPSAASPRVPLSFSSLRLLVIRDLRGYSIPQAFWQELSELPTLEIIHIRSPDKTLVAQLLNAMVICDMKSDLPASSTSSSQQRVEEASEPVSHPFPALQSLVLHCLESVGQNTPYDLRCAGYKIPKAWEHLPSIAVYLRCIASRLRCWRDYGRKYLLYLCLQAEAETLDMNESNADKKSQELFKEVDDATMRMLKKLSVYIVFGSTVVWDMCADKEEKSKKPMDAPGETTASTVDGTMKE